MTIPKQVLHLLAETYGLGHSQGLAFAWYDPEADVEGFADAVAAYQREKDAVVCLRMDGEHDILYAEAILNQGTEQ